MKAPKFMFINKNAESDSLSHSHKRERIQIHSHVQKGRRYKKSEGGIIYSSPLPLLQPGCRSGTSNRSDTNSKEGDKSGGQASAQAILSFSPDQTDVQSLAKDDLQQLPMDPNIDPLLLWDYFHGYSSPTCSPPSIPVFPASAEENFDPFDATCVKVDNAIYSLLQYYLNVHHPNIWHLERTVRQDHKYTFRYDAMTMIQGCLHDEYNMYALLAGMASYMSCIDGVVPSGNTNYYIHKALKASQNYVQSQQPITGRVIFNVFQLGCAEWYRYNVDAAYVHLKAAKQMVDSMGGLRTLQGPLAELLLTGDEYVAAEMRKKPLWSDADFDSGDEHPMIVYGLQELQKILSGTVTTASGLLTSAHQDIITANLRWVILDLAVALSVLKTLRSSLPPQETKPTEGLHWIYMRTLAVRNRLLHMDLQDARSDAVRIALLLWIFMCFTVAGRRRSIKVVAPFLKQTLEVVPEEQWEEHEEVRLWVLSIGALSAAVGSEVHEWFKSRIIVLPVAELGDSDLILGAMTALSDKFFHLESAQKNDLRALANDIQSTRKPRKGRKSKATSKRPKAGKTT